MKIDLGNIFNKDNTLKRLQQEIKGVELKKQSLVSGLQQEIQLLNQKINDTLLQIGLNVYTHHNNGSEIGDDLLPYYSEIASLNTHIKEKEEKIEEFVKRYDEEIELLQKNISQMNNTNIQTNSSSANLTSSNIPTYFCKNCGAAYTPSKDVFCGNCGQKLV